MKKHTALNVVKGVEAVNAVNPNFKKKKKKQISTKQYIEGIKRGDINILSQAITLIESRNEEDQPQAEEIVERCLPLSGNSIRIGVTGVPGAGKSSFIEAIGGMIEAKGKKLAVLAIDPSSERTKGSILGDKTRMETIATNLNVFIRPSPSAGSLGGVARKTRETVFLCEAAGYDVIFIETVGVGQSEIAVDSMVDIFIMLQIAGAGDELQGIKRGIMEMADIVAITKADGDNVLRAEVAKQEIQNATMIFPLAKSKWRPRVFTCSARDKMNLEVVWGGVEEYMDFIKANGYFDQHRREQRKYWMYETINNALKESFYGDQSVAKELKKQERLVVELKKSSFKAAREILKTYFRR